MLSNYEGTIGGLPVLIQQFNHSYQLLNSDRVRDTTRSRVIDNVEAQLFSIIQQATQGNQNNIMWLAVNRREIHEILNRFNEIRNTINRPRDASATSPFNALNRQFSSISNMIAGNSIIKAALIKSSVLGFSTLLMGGILTGASAATFAAGPEVGVPVVITTGAASLVASGGAAIYGGVKDGALNMENNLRAQYRR